MHPYHTREAIRELEAEITRLHARPSLSLSQIGDLADAVAYARQYLGEAKAVALLEALRTELSKEGDGAA